MTTYQASYGTNNEKTRLSSQRAAPQYHIHEHSSNSWEAFSVGSYESKNVQNVHKHRHDYMESKDSGSKSVKSQSFTTPYYKSRYQKERHFNGPMEEINRARGCEISYDKSNRNSSLITKSNHEPGIHGSSISLLSPDKHFKELRKIHDKIMGFGRSTTNNYVSSLSEDNKSTTEKRISHPVLESNNIIIQYFYHVRTRKRFYGTK